MLQLGLSAHNHGDLETNKAAQSGFHSCIASVCMLPANTLPNVLALVNNNYHFAKLVGLTWISRQLLCSSSWRRLSNF